MSLFMVYWFLFNEIHRHDYPVSEPTRFQLEILPWIMGPTLVVSGLLTLVWWAKGLVR